MDKSLTVASGAFTVPPPLSWVEPVTFRPELKVTGNVTTNGSLTAQNIVSRTGYFGVNTGTKSYYPIAVVDYDENGGFCGYRGFGGMTAIGSGESVAALQNSVETEFGMGHGSENLFVCSDQGIWFLPECNTWENHGTIQLQTNGIYKRLMNRTRGDGDTSTLFLQHFLCDKNGNGSTSRYAGFEANTRNGAQAMIMAYDPRGANTNYASIEVRYSSDGVITTSAPTPPTGDRSTQIATTASFDNEGFIGYKKLTSIQSAKGSFWFDSDSGIDLDDAHLSDIVSGADWYGIQLGMTRGADKSQYLFNSAGIWRRYSDANLGSETWGDWTQIVNTKGLIAATAPEPVTSSHFLRSKSLRKSVFSSKRSPCAWHKGCSSSCARKSPWLMGNQDSTRHYQHSQKNSRSRWP